MGRPYRSENNGLALISLVLAVVLAVPAFYPIFTDPHKKPDLWVYIVLVVVAVLMLLALIYPFREWLAATFLQFIDSDNGYEILPCRDDQVAEIHEIAERLFGENITDVDKIKQIRKKYKDGLQVSTRKSISGKTEVCGYYFMFPINSRCVKNIHDFTFKVDSLAEEDIATKPRYGNAMYIGAVVGLNPRAKSELMGAIKNASHAVRETHTRTAYARAATKAGILALRRNGFKPVHPEASGLNCFFQKVLDGPDAKERLVVSKRRRRVPLQRRLI